MAEKDTAKKTVKKQQKVKDLIETHEDYDDNPQKIKKLVGSIKGETGKALLIQFDNELEAWIPKSTIHSGFDNIKDKVQK